MTSTDTIIACSSPPGRGLRALVRCDGPGAAAVLAHWLDSPSPGARLVVKARLRSRLGLPPIPVLGYCFRGPRSYTGNDTAELQLPGHPALIERVLQAALQVPAVRLAEPGEFTFRAYLNGRLDLTRAEGVAATIAARSDAELAAATQLRTGTLGRFAAALVDDLAAALALLEAGIDFTDQDDVVPIPPPELGRRVASIIAKLDELLANSRRWGDWQALPRVVLVGPPSAGKSTLFNALLGHDRAVIDATPGTTRDVLSEHLTLTASQTGLPHHAELLLCDLAGLDDPVLQRDRAVQEGVRKAIDQADLVIACSPADAALPADPIATHTATIRVLTKADLMRNRQPRGTAKADAIYTSAATEEGLPALRRAIADALTADQQPDQATGHHAAEALALQPRHVSSLSAALAALRDAEQLTQAQLIADATRFDQPELVAGSLRLALDHLAALGGVMTPDDVIGKVFATFCVGK